MNTATKRAEAFTPTQSSPARQGGTETNPMQELTMTSHITQPAKGAIPLDLINPDDLTKMDAMQLYSLLDGLQTLDDVLSGLSAQPRFMLDSTFRFNSAGQVLADLSDALSKAKETIADEAKKRPTDKSTTDARWLGWTKVQYEAEFLESFAGLTAVVASAAQAQEEARG